MQDFLTRLLTHYQLSKEEYDRFCIDPSQISLPDVSKLRGIEAIVARLNSAIENKEKIIVYGDYDCDGVTATSIVVETFNKLNYPVSYYIPSRYIDGYGLNVDNVVKIAKQNFKLIICVDNGISAFEAIDKANELGIDVIVVDHHEVPKGDYVNAYGILHPQVSELGDVFASGGYMSLFLSRALLGYYDDYLTTLAGLSVVSDMMELKTYNRDVVKLAINNLKNNKYKPLTLLCESPIIDEKTFGLEIAPKINAVGRMVSDKSVNLSVKYLLSKDDDELLKLSSFIKSQNDERKNLTKQAAETIDKDIAKESAICIELPIKEGLIGLVANRLLNEYHLPSVVFTFDEKDPTILKGSARSKEGFSITKAWESLNKYLLTGGGHALAGGLSIKRDDFNGFKQEFLALAKKYPLVEEEKESIDIEVNEITLTNYQILRNFAPFGVGFEEPIFKIAHLPTRGLSFISGGKHLSTPLSIDAKLLGFNIDESSFKKMAYVDLFGTYNMSFYRGSYSLEFRIKNYIESK